MNKPVLVVLAAGMGSRYGGLKQIDPMGKNGEKILDYSVYDAKRAGFETVVFVIKPEMEQEFEEAVGKHLRKHIEVKYAFQSLDKLPEGFSLPEGRTKPWGTGHAVLCAADVIDAPFAVINADDYYVKEGFRNIHAYLTSDARKEKDFCMTGFVLGNTLSENGGVTRGICQMDENGYLTGVKETKHVVKTETGAAVETTEGLIPVDSEGLVSMNMWGLTPEFIDMLEKGFPEFLKNIPEGDIKAEYLLPTIIDQLIQKKDASVAVLRSNDTWFGVTYKEDKEYVMEAFEKLIADGVYQKKLFG